MEEINKLLRRLENTKISYSVGFYAIALMVNKGLITIEEIVDFIEKTELEIKDEYKTEMKNTKQLEEIKKMFKKEIVKIECVFVDSIKEYIIGIVFADETYITLKAYEDMKKIKLEIEKTK